MVLEYVQTIFVATDKVVDRRTGSMGRSGRYEIHRSPRIRILFDMLADALAELGAGGRLDPA